MPQKPLSRQEIERTIALIDDAIKRGFKLNGQMPSAIAEVARVEGVDRRQVEHRIISGQQRYGIGGHIPLRSKKKLVTDAMKHRVGNETRPEEPTLPDLPDDDIPDDEIIDLMCRRYSKRAEHKQAKKWFRIEMPSSEPFAIMWWGDPHLDNAGTNWPMLKAHAELASEPGVYSVNIGDTLDNWPHASRLIRLYAHSDTSVETARKLARWFLKGSGIRWLVWLFGNHDAWEGHTSAEWTREVGGKAIAFEEWGAQFVLACPNGQEFRIWAAHDFPGNSMWNPLHGPKKAAAMKEAADVYVCGHRHNWALYREESAERGFSYSLIRTRGYKFIDSHAEKLGHFPQEHGASVLTVFDPATGRHYDFEHPEDGVVFLRALRRKAA
jgi:hypothetical protein